MATLESMQVLQSVYERSGSRYGLGKFFAHRYLETPNDRPDILHADNDKAFVLITDWLIEHDYLRSLPYPRLPLTELDIYDAPPESNTSSY